MLRDRHENANQPIPSTLFPPTIAEGYEVCFAAFLDLNADRQMTMGTGPIPFAAISEYATRLGVIDGDEFWLFYEMIRIMDVAFLKKINK